MPRDRPHDRSVRGTVLTARWRAVAETKLRDILPAPLRKRLKRLRDLAAFRQPTVAEGWEKYARNFHGDRLGDEWNRPDLEGLDVAPERFVESLDEALFGPFIGHVGTLLEIGPGGGRFTEVLLPRCDVLIAADTSASMLKRIRQRFPASEKVRCIHLDGTGLAAVADCTVDAAFSYGVFVHLQQWDIYRYLEEIARVLRPGGVALIQHSNTFSDAGWKYFLREVPLQVNRNKLFGTYTVMTPDVMAEFATRAGLECVECRTDLLQTEAISLFRRPGSAPASTTGDRPDAGLL